MNTTTPEMQSLKARLKATWMAGDYGLIAKSTELGAEEFISRLALKPRTRLLDVACGSGNLAMAAARRGAFVTGVDIAPNLLEQGRERAKAEGLTIHFEEEARASRNAYTGGTWLLLRELSQAMGRQRRTLTLFPTGSFQQSSRSTIELLSRDPTGGVMPMCPS